MGSLVVGHDGSACDEAALEEALRIAPPLGDVILGATTNKASASDREAGARGAGGGE